MRIDCCSSEVSFKLWVERTYYSFWDVVNRKKWLRPLYKVHYRILCWLGKDDFEDIPGLFDDDNPYNPEKFIEECRKKRSDEDIRLGSEFEAEIRRINYIVDTIGIDYFMLTHEKDAELGRYCIYLHEAHPEEEQLSRLSRLLGYRVAYSESEQEITIDLEGKFAEYEKHLEEKKDEGNQLMP